MSLPLSKNPELLPAAPAVAAVDSPQQSAPPALFVEPVYESSAMAYGAKLQYTIDGTKAKATRDGKSQAFTSEPGVEPNAILLAMGWAKQLLKAGLLAEKQAEAAQIKAAVARAKGRNNN